MLLTVGSAWSLQPRDGLYAATGNLSYCHLSVKQCCSEYFNCYIISPTIFSLYALSTTMGIPNKGLRQQQFMVILLLPESFSPKILYIHVSCLLVCSDNCFFLSSVYPSAREVSALLTMFIGRKQKAPTTGVNFCDSCLSGVNWLP